MVKLCAFYLLVVTAIVLPVLWVPVGVGVALTVRDRRARHAAELAASDAAAELRAQLEAERRSDAVAAYFR